MRSISSAAVAGMPPQAVAASVGQGENTTRFALSCGAEINKDAPGMLIAVGQQPKGFAAREGHDPQSGREDRSGSCARTGWRRSPRRARGKAGKAVAAGVDSAWFKADTAVANLSSIVMLVEGFGRRILLTGDQRSDHVLDGLKSTGKLKDGETLHVDIMKVPHHGSKANVQPEFIARVTADVYVFCANGKDQNPDPPVLELVAGEARKGRKFTMAFTNGDMVYALDDHDKFGEIRGTPVKTLAEAITELKKDPDIANNVTFKFRDPARHSVVFSLPPKA